MENGTTTILPRCTGDFRFLSRDQRGTSDFVSGRA
ncbi:rCG63280 [Rattus norvegicus]|uniref:RCG63280 n=1 Tax=Rattus norvegicus TaxID=10116 RepID=A6J546_RAT|nr:rCG63280 [Rattus norvegicus]